MGLPASPNAATEVLAGLEMGGIAIVTALARITRLPAAFVRKQAKAYGTARLAEGADVAGRRVTVVEDVVTSGGQVHRGGPAEVAVAAQNQDAHADSSLTDRQPGAPSGASRGRNVMSGPGEHIGGPRNTRPSCSAEGDGDQVVCRQRYVVDRNRGSNPAPRRTRSRSGSGWLSSTAGCPWPFTSPSRSCG